MTRAARVGHPLTEITAVLVRKHDEGLPAAEAVADEPRAVGGAEREIRAGRADRVRRRPAAAEGQQRDRGGEDDPGPLHPQSDASGGEELEQPHCVRGRRRLVLVLKVRVDLDTGGDERPYPLRQDRE